MDLNKKLDFYRQKKATAERKNISVTPAVQALSDEFGGIICQPTAPYLKIVRSAEALCCNSFAQKIRRNYINRLPEGREVDLKRCLFFDLETTGLAGGAGTFAFLLGFAFFDGEGLHIEQYFLPEYGREYFLFKALQPWLKSFDTLVSFNGKSYDLPLLKSRFVLNRLDWPGPDMLHYDLLHAARRLWKDSFLTCDLETLEKKLLQRQRSDDIPGAYIPQAYFSFLQTGIIHDIKRIIDHNYLDLLSLAELLLLVEEVVRQPAKLDGTALQRYLYIAFKERDMQLFEKLLVEVKRKEGAVPARIKAWYSLLNKQRGNWQLAEELWLELSEYAEYSFFALEELAKYHEHQTGNIHKALEYTKQALHKLEVLHELNPYAAGQERITSFKYRLRRLQGKKS